MLLSLVVALPGQSAQSREPDRTLKLYFGHTGERGSFTFKRNGRYDRKELERVNRFLRDWRKEESTRMDPQLLDLVWEIYDESGSDDYVHIISAYRSPKTNKMLRDRSSGVAKNSQHIRGKAMDFSIPDVPLDKLRVIAMKKQGGGVGYYPRSGSPFVHVDTGSVRAWPRMSRQQLIALFPNGGTLHLPADGKPLPGYERAVARRQTAGETTLAYLETEPDEDAAPTVANTSGGNGGSGGVKAWLKGVFQGDGRDEGTTDTDPAAAPATTAEPQLIAADDPRLEPRRPRARPQAEVELAAAEVVPALVAQPSADERTMAALAFAPLPKTRPDPVFLAASLSTGEEEHAGAEPLPIESNVIARLAAPDQATPLRKTGTDDPITLAFAALEDSPALPSEDDRMVIAAFAAMRAESAGPPDAVGEAAAPQQQPRPLALAALTPALPPAPAEESADGPGIVLGPDGLPSYSADQDAMRGLIATPATYDPQFARLEMPVPADAGASVYRAPKAADEVSGLAAGPGLPVDRFASSEPSPAPAERGFFMRLFASLIE
ncbi:MAG: DUF882 domain-containing protein [Propylenella sp.]